MSLGYERHGTGFSFLLPVKPNYYSAATSGMSLPLVEEAASLQASLFDHIFPSKRTIWVPRTTCHYSNKTFLGGIVPLCILTNQDYTEWPKIMYTHFDMKNIYYIIVTTVFIQKQN